LIIDHIYLPVTDVDRSLDFYRAVLTPLDFAHRWDFKAQAGWPDLYGFGGDSPGFWLKKSSRSVPELYVAFTALSEQAVQDAYDAALSHGGTDNGAPGLRPHFGPDITLRTSWTRTATAHIPQFVLTHLREFG
jgi:catechol 2,3-dioxygenase-like lactoylglutathione lyase family enzyme